jgi:hypothetical protein
MIEPVRYTPGVETVEPDEAKISAGINAVLHTILETTSQDYGHAVRAVHAKTHGLLEGELTIAGDLPADLAQGIAATAGTHKVFLRISTIAGDILPDAVSLPRGLAIKILDVAGERLPGSEGDSTQDLLLVNGPAFGAAHPGDFLGSLSLLARTTDKAETAKVALSAVLRGTEALIEAFGGQSSMVRMLGGAPRTQPLGETFYSQTAFRYGDYIAKFAVAPVSPQLVALADQTFDLADREDALRDEVDAVIAAHGGEWELRVQLCVDLATMPIEDASVVWDEARSPFRAIGRIRVAPQPAWSEDKARRIDDGLAFSPWHGLAAHQPLGAINRARRSAYPLSADFRGAFNGCPIHEPAG